MREILLDELKDRQIAILDVVDAFCRENEEKKKKYIKFPEKIISIIGLIQERYWGL